MIVVINLRRNFKILWFGSLITELGNAMTLPFIVLYIQTLGEFTTPQLNGLAAAAFAITYVSKALVSPLWGRLADLKGRKLMCLRALQGAFSGYINNANALVSLTTPVAMRGQQLSKLITGSITGTLLGPLLGGLLATSVGYRGAFFVTGLLMGLVFGLTWWGVTEAVTPVEREALPPLWPVLRQIGLPFLLALFSSLLVIQATTNAITPILSLFVGQLVTEHSQIVLMTGLVAAAPGFATILMANRVGRWLDQIGATRCLIIFLSLAIVNLVLTSFVVEIWQLGLLRFILGIADAALLPAIQVLTIEHVPRAAFGRVFSLNQSAQSTGNVVGPLLAAAIANHWGYQPIFFVTACLEAIVLGLWVSYFRLQRRR